MTKINREHIRYKFKIRNIIDYDDCSIIGYDVKWQCKDYHLRGRYSSTVNIDHYSENEDEISLLHNLKLTDFDYNALSNFVTDDIEAEILDFVIQAWTKKKMNHWSKWYEYLATDIHNLLHILNNTEKEDKK